MLLILTCWAFSGTLFAQSAPQVEGSLPRNLNDGRFTLTITITNLSQTLIDRGVSDRSGNEGLDDRFAIKLSFAQSVELTTDAEKAKTSDAKFYMQEAQPVELDPSDVTNATGTHTLRYHINIIEAVPGELAAKVGTSDSLTMQVFFYLGVANNKDPVCKNESVSIKRDVYLIDAQPAFDPTTPIVGSHKSLIVNWQVQKSVKTSGGDGSAKEPSDVVVYVVHPDVGSQAFPAKQFSGSAGTADADASCQYTRPAAAEAATCIQCGDKVYLNRIEIGKIPGVTVVSAKNATGGVKVDGLDNDISAPYTVFMQYLPDGLGASQCLPGQPSPNFTLTELNGEGDAKVVDFRCFIATAAYGSPLHADLAYFRKFRSQVLLKSALGRRFVHYYYKYSPPVAQYISEHPALRDFVRGFLEVPAELLKTVDEFY